MARLGIHIPTCYLLINVNERIAPLSFLHGCRNKGLIAFAPEIDCDLMAMGLPHVTSAILLIAK
jgi:hypothetical protein